MPITFTGIGSGIDAESIISGLVAASRDPINRIRSQQTRVDSAVSTLSNVGTLLSRLETSVRALDSLREVGSFKVSSTDTNVAASVSGNAQAGSFDVRIRGLASSYKAYSDQLTTTSSQQLGQSGTLGLTVGGESADLTIEASDTVDTIVGKINGAGLGVTASTLFDGTRFHIQLRGSETGTANEVTVVETGTSLGFANHVLSHGKDAEFSIDGFDMTSPTNQVQGAIGGTTLALAKVSELDENNDPIATTVTIDSDPNALKSKLTSFVDAYNGVVGAIQGAAGFGSTAATNPELAGDAALRAISQRLNGVLSETVGSGRFQTLGSIGLELSNSGTLRLNDEKFGRAVSQDAEGVAAVLAGNDASGSAEVRGAMDRIATLANSFLAPRGLISTRKDGLSSRSRTLTDRADEEQRRLDRMEQQLRKQFTEMDQAVSANQAKMTFLGS